MPTNNPIIKTFFKRIFRNRLQFRLRILFCLLSTENGCREVVTWVLERWKKSAGAISGEYDGCLMMFVEFLARNSFTMTAFVRWCVIVVQNPWIFLPEICPFSKNCLSQTLHNVQIIFFIYRLTNVKKIFDNLLKRAFWMINSRYFFDRTYYKIA